VTILNQNVDSGINLYLYRTQPMSYSKKVKNIRDSEYSFRQLNPAKGPFFVIAGNDEYFGVSETVDLSNFAMNNAEVKINLSSKKDNFQLSHKIVNKSTREPVPIVTCNLNAITLDSYGRIKNINKTILSNYEGFVKFDDLPTLHGTIEFKNSQYKSVVIPINLFGKNLKEVK